MISTDDNLYFVGKHVEEPTQQELGDAIGSLRGIFTVVRAVQKMRRLRLHRRSVSGQSTEPPSSPGEQSFGPSHQSSVDSYMTMGSGSASDSRPGETDASTVDDGDPAKYADIVGADREVMSPKSTRSFDDSDVGTQRHDSDEKDGTDKGGALKIDTGAEQTGEENQGSDDVQMFDSPTSDEEMGTPVATGTGR